ncbi:hypothetical protein WP50_30135 [Lactiplantibacillus plantarum]|nr:hypothetical protein WP50_30135 [Lactiplantibacillus plantarum]
MANAFYTQNGQTITFAFAQPLQLTIVTSEIIRVFINRGEQGESYAIEGHKIQATDFTIESAGDHYIIRTSALTIHLDSERHLDTFDKDGNALITDYRGERIHLKGFAQPLQLTIVTSEIIRVFINRGEQGESYAIEGHKIQATDFTIESAGDHYIIRTSALTIHLDSERHLDTFDKDGNALITDYRGERIHFISMFIAVLAISIIKQDKPQEDLSENPTK